MSLLRLSPLPELGHSINSVLVWSASPCKAVPSSSTIPLCVQEKVTDDETADSDSREMGEEQSWHSAGGALMTMVLRLVSIELGVSLHSGSCGEEAKVEVDTPVTNCVNMINGISDDQKERTNDDSLRTLLFDDSSPGVASVSTQKLSPSTPSLPSSPSLLPSPSPSLLPSLLPSPSPSLPPSLRSSNSLSPPAVQVCIMPPDSIFEGSKELSAHYDFRYLMTSAVQTSTVVRVYECINLNSTFGLCLRCITHQGGGMVGEKGINTHNLVGMHRDDNAPFRHSMVRHSNIVRMDRVRSGYSNGEQFRVVLQGLPSHSTEELGTCSNIGMIVMTSTAFEETYVNGGNSLLESEEEKEIELRRNRKIEFTKAVYIGQNVGSMSITFPSAVDSPDASYCEWAVLIVEQRECNERLCTDPATPDEMDPNYAILGTIPLNECPSDVCMISLMREREGGLYSVKADYLHPLVTPPMPHSMSRSDSGAFRRQSNSLENSGEEFDRRGEQCKLSSPHSPRVAVIPSESYMQFDPSDVAYATQNPCRVALILAFLCCRIAVKTILYCTILFLATKVPYIFIAPEGVYTGLWQAYLSQKSEGGALLSPTVTSNVTGVSSDVRSYLSGKILSQLSSNTWMKGEGKYIEIADVEIKRIGVEEDVAVKILMEIAIVADDNGKEVESFISSLTPSPILTVGCSVNLNTKTVSERVISLVRTFLLPVYLMLRVMLQGFFKLLNDGWRSMTRGTERRANSM